jgi:hypothetical protein
MRATKRRATGDQVAFGKVVFHGETRIGVKADKLTSRLRSGRPDTTNSSE